MPPRFSVVVPAFNAATTVASAVKSVLSQTVSDLEVIVVDDGSTDGTADVVSRIPDHRVRCLSQPNRGLPAARNTGILAAGGEYIAFLDSDDFYLPRYLELAEAALAMTPGAGFAYTDAYVFDEAAGKVRRRSATARARPPVPPPSDREAFLFELLRANFVYYATVVPRAPLAAVGRFDESRVSSEDYDLWLRILIHGYRAAWIPGRHAIYRKRTGQMSSNLGTMSRSLLAVYEGLRMEDMPSEVHRTRLAARRQAARREAAIISRVERLIPLRLIGAIKRAGLGDSWYTKPPPEVAETLASATASDPSGRAVADTAPRGA